MRTATPATIRLKDYKPTPFEIKSVALDILLDPQATRVRSTLHMTRRRGSDGPLVLDGEAIKLVSLKIEGKPVDASSYQVDATSLTIPRPPRGAFILEIETLCNPQANTQLSGLYRSSGTFCTQCEAQGFRRITYFYDRPDVMAPFSVRIEADRATCPVLLSNGNPGETGTIAGTDRHFAIWTDPHPKPSYLFALVAGDLAGVFDSFTTASGRKIDLRIYVEKGKQDRCVWAMEALKASMRWDEVAFGREYDLDVFSIVAVADFNMGAMENKGLNIFNDKFILAKPDTATDTDYMLIEAIIAHEYFHNWTGNRITCRDWFQLCLKEGLTVFRDQEFTSDTRSRAVKRIEDVRLLRARQFSEDAGPLSHAARPEAYIEINNFYTATVYEKGAEICRLMKTIIGEKAFARAMTAYFKKFDGTAATVEDFVGCMAKASGEDAKHFMAWYRQAGTPRVTARSVYDAKAKTLSLTLEQKTHATPGQVKKQPLLMPLALGLVGRDGTDMPLDLKGTGRLSSPVIRLSKAKQTFVFQNVAQRPVLSLNRGFSAPILLDANLTLKEQIFLVGHDTDSFNRWEAGQAAASRLILATIKAQRLKKPAPDLAAFGNALRAVLEDDSLEDAFKAQMLMLPSENDLAGHIASNIDPDAIHRARTHVRKQLGKILMEPLSGLWRATAETGSYSPDSQACGRRALRYGALGLIGAADTSLGARLAWEEFSNPASMTAEAGALNVLVRLDCPERDQALDLFYARHRDDHLLVNVWFGLQGQIPHRSTVRRVRDLMNHADFNIANPNRVRALVGGFSQANPVAFHSADGSGYRLLADTVMKLDALNPQVAARLAGGFSTWATLEPKRRAIAQTLIAKIAKSPKISRDTGEILGKALRSKPASR